jgi:hypothetical protein
MDEPVVGRQDGYGRAERGRALVKQATRTEQQNACRMHEATEATPEMAAYFLGALRDQSSRAGVFQRQLRWQRLRHALTTEQDVVAQEHLATQLVDRRPAAVLPIAVPIAAPIPVPAAQLTTSEARPEPTQAAAG